ncbi:SxtJ family membrane protein [Desulfovibrio sp.]|uniref:SxtJ family membrane protein n=1 Tax=Desulfovibrio sp. TaxID=885 RepID=UPI0025BBA3B5|nr:SxtJ family membrane protein [Desulfovibrio sp.]
MNDKECADTAMAMTLICLLVITYIRSLALLPLAIVLLLLGMVWPRAYKPLAMLWLGISLLLGSVMSRVVLSIIFAVIVTPIALVMRLFGHDPMRRKAWKKGTDSTFVTRDYLVEAKDLEHPF